MSDCLLTYRKDHSTLVRPTSPSLTAPDCSQQDIDCAGDTFTAAGDSMDFREPVSAEAGRHRGNLIEKFSVTDLGLDVENGTTSRASR